jgi:hypothetical protein
MPETVQSPHCQGSPGWPHLRGHHSDERQVRSIYLVGEDELAMAIKVNWHVFRKAESRVFDAWKGEIAVTAAINEAALLKSRDLLKKLSRIWLCSSMGGALHRKTPAVQGVQLC